MRHLLLTLLAAMALPAAAQLTADKAFTSAPADIFPLLDTNTRLDMVDYFNSGLATQSANRLQGRSAISALSPTSVTISLTQASTAQIALLPAGSDTIIALINTVASPGLDSTIRFYDSSWQPLKASRYFTAPTWDDWTTSGHKADEITSYAPFMLASYTINPEDGSLTITNNLSTLLDKDTYETISPAMQPSLTYKWNGKQYTR